MNCFYDYHFEFGSELGGFVEGLLVSPSLVLASAAFINGIALV